MPRPHHGVVQQKARKRVELLLHPNLHAARASKNALRLPVPTD
jgi:hypothetical protein